MNKEYTYDDFEILVEEDNGVHTLHCYVFRFSPSVMREIIKVFGQVLNDYSGHKLYAVTKNAKFAEVMGGRYLATVNNYEVFEWESKPL